MLRYSSPDIHSQFDPGRNSMEAWTSLECLRAPPYFYHTLDGRDRDFRWWLPHYLPRHPGPIAARLEFFGTATAWRHLHRSVASPKVSPNTIITARDNSFYPPIGTCLILDQNLTPVSFRSINIQHSLFHRIHTSIHNVRPHVRRPTL